MDDDKRTKLGTLDQPPGLGGSARGNTGQAALATAALQSAPPGSSQPPTPQVSQTSYLPPQVDPMLGQVMAGRYLISKKLGEGGMGAVYLATHLLLEKSVALKVLHGEFARKPDLVERFMQEAKAASRIRHENVIDISDFGSTPDGMVFFAMEHLKGHDLHEEVARARLAGELLPWSRSKRIFLQICSALQAAHALGIVHRDLKPENIYLVEFLGEPDFVKLLDFGIAKLTDVSDDGTPGRKLTRTGMLFGTPEYMSPEQARGENVDHRVDVYAMGCILFQLVTGRVPFEADNFMGVLSLHLTEPAPSIPVEVFDRIGAPREIANVIERALLKDRNARFQTIEELSNAVRTVCGDPLPSGMTGMMQAQRVQAPATTTHRAQTPTGMVQPYGAPQAAASPTGLRQRTQWTGNLNVPAAEDGVAARGGSKLPWILLAVVLLGGGGLAAFFALGTKQPTAVAAQPGSAAPGSAIAIAAPLDAAIAPAVPDAAQVAAVVPDAAAPLAKALPAQTVIHFDSAPPKAKVYEGSTFIGTTPFQYKRSGSYEARKYRFVLSGYQDTLVEWTAEEPVIHDKEVLVRGSGTVHKVKDPTTTPVQDTGPVTVPHGDPVVKPTPEVKPPPEDDCEFPCLKRPKELGSAATP